MNISQAPKTPPYLTITILLCVWGASGCVGATRLPARSKGPAGETLQKKELDLTFLEHSGIQREEVRHRLAVIDTSYANPRLFWGRWSDSKWGYWWFVAAQTGGAGDAKRVWHVHNVLVTFDEDGLLQKKMVIDDEKALWHELHAQLTNAPPLDLSQPLAVNVTQSMWPTEITLTKDSVEITRHRRKVTVIQVSPLQILRISNNASINGSSVTTTCHTLHLSEKSAMGKNICFCADAPAIASIFQYLSQHGRRDMLWE